MEKWWNEKPVVPTGPHPLRLTVEYCCLCRAGWHAGSAAELERILRLEFPGDVIDRFLIGRSPTSQSSYGIALFAIHM